MSNFYTCAPVNQTRLHNAHKSKYGGFFSFTEEYKSATFLYHHQVSALLVLNQDDVKNSQKDSKGKKNVDNFRL